MKRRVRMEVVQEGAAVTPLELFFDLVFVFALIQVTEFMAEDMTFRGLLRGVLIVGLLWWSWICYAWLGNVVRADEGAPRAAVLVAMAAMFVLALAIPEAFDDMPGGLPGPVVVAVCYFVFRLIHLVLFWFIAQDDPGLRRQLLRFSPAMFVATVLLLVASLLQGPAQTLAWAAALLADYLGTLLGGASGWRLRSATHFAERHGLILLIALGESIVAIGIGMAGLPISWPIVAAAVLGLTVSAALWWSYFDVTALLAERALASAPEHGRARLARDAYTYLHAPMACGIVLLALGMKKVLEYVGDPVGHDLAEPLQGLALYSLYGGVALYLLTHVVFKLRAVRITNVYRLVVGVLVLLLIPLGAVLPALAALAVLAGVLVALVIGEFIHLGPERRRVRHS